MEVKPRVVFGALQRGYHRLGSRMGGAQRQRGEGGINDIGPRLDSLEHHHRGQARGVMGMELNGDLYRLLEGLDQIIGRIRGQKASHVLDADGIRTRVLQLLGVIGKILDIKDRAGGVGNGRLHMGSFLFGGLDGCLEVTDIVERVKNADDIDAVGNRFLDEILDHVVGIMAVPQHILSTEEHLQLGLGAFFADGAQPLPWVLIQKAQAGVESGAAPAFQRMIPHLVQQLQRGHHLVNGHPGRDQRLMRVSQHRFGNSNTWHNILHSSAEPIGSTGKAMVSRIHIPSFKKRLLPASGGHRLLQGNQGLARLNRGVGSDMHAGNHAVVRGLDFILHLHSLQNAEHVAFGNRIAGRNLDA